MTVLLSQSVFSDTSSINLKFIISETDINNKLISVQDKSKYYNLTRTIKHDDKNFNSDISRDYYLIIKNVIENSSDKSNIDNLVKLSETGLISSSLFLSYIYLHGVYVEKDIDRGINYLTKAANAGDGFAANTLGSLYMSKLNGLTDISKAKYWFESAVKLGNASGYYNLGQLSKMITDEKSLKSFEFYMLKAAEAEHSGAQYNLYVLYIEKNPDEARKWLEKSAYNNLPIAQYNYALSLYTNDKDSHRVIIEEFLTKAMDKQFPKAFSLYGLLLADNSKNSDDFALAESYLLRGLKLGDSNAYQLLLVFYQSLYEEINDCIYINKASSLINNYSGKLTSQSSTKWVSSNEEKCSDN